MTQTGHEDKPVMLYTPSRCMSVFGYHVYTYMHAMHTMSVCDLNQWWAYTCATNLFVAETNCC